nr:ribonuclease H-like domain-containing protein [Tanacetum cinerariifolium]
MNTGASSYLNFSASNLSTVFYKRLFPSVHVGDGKSISVTNTGHSIVPSHHRPLHLHNVLVTPNIIKNIISVRQFTRDNNCTIEFDTFSFFVNDYLTRHILLRCDSSGDLYPVTKPSTSPIAFLSTSASAWHQRLGHPGDQVLRSLVSSRFVSLRRIQLKRYGVSSPHLHKKTRINDSKIRRINLPPYVVNLDNSTNNVLIPLDSWTSGILEYKLPLSKTLESVPKPVESKPKAVSEPKVWSDDPIIEEYESDSDDEYVFKDSVEQEKPSCAFINTVKHVKTPRQTVKDQDTCSQNPKFGAPYQPGGKYRAAGPGFYQQNHGNSLYPDRRPSLEESLTKFIAELAKRHEENSNIIKEIRASTDAAIRNQGASIKTLEIQIRQMSKVLQERGFESLPSSTKTNPRDQVKSISTVEADFSKIRCIGCGPEARDVKILEAYDRALPQKEKDPGTKWNGTIIHNICFDKALVDFGASVSVMPFSTYTNLGLGILSHTRLTIELADRTIKQPKGIAKNVLVRIGKLIFSIDFIILDILDVVPLILGQPFLSTAHSKIDVFKRKITFMLKNLYSKIELIGEGDESFDPMYGNYIELNDLDAPKTNQDGSFDPTFVKTNSYKMKFSCVIGYKYVNADLLPSFSINLMSKSFYYSIIKDKDEGKIHAETLVDIPVFVRNFSIITGFTIIDGDDVTKDVVLGMKFCKKYTSCQMILKKFALRDKYERINDE